MIALEKETDLRGGKVPWTSCKPFVENSQGVLIHRPRMVTTHKIGPKWAAHISIHYWCGNFSSGTKKFTFLDAPEPRRIVCAKCEQNAVAADLPSSNELAGRHVHVGSVVAIAHCCAGITDGGSNGTPS